MTSLGVSALMLSQSPKQWYFVRRQQVGLAPLHQELDVFDHRRVLAFEHPAVAVDLVDRPGADDAGLGPGGSAVVAGDLHRRDHRELAVGALAVGQVDQPLVEERLNVAVERRGADVDLRVARPAQPLVALGAVGGDVDEVGALGPVGVAVQLVEHRVGALEPAHDRRRARKGQADDRVVHRRRLEAGDLQVLIAVEGEPGRPDLLVAALADVGVDAAGLAEVGRVDGAVGIEPLGEPEDDLLAGLAAEPKPGDAREVLAVVEHVDARARLRERPGLQLDERRHRRAGVRLDDRLHLRAGDRPAPSRRRGTSAGTSRASRAGRRRSRPSGSRPRGSGRSTPSSPGRWRPRPSSRLHNQRRAVS